MKLFYNPASPFVRKVVACLHEAGFQDDVEFALVTGTPSDPNSLRASENPLGKIPTLVLDSGKTIYDSRTICRYIDNLHEAGLYPEGDDLWDTLVLEAIADGMMDAAVLMVYEQKCREEAIRSAEWVEGQWSKIDRSLVSLESNWMNHLNSTVDMGTIAVGCALGYLDLRHSGRNWRNGHDDLASWFEQFSTRNCMSRTVPYVP